MLTCRQRGGRGEEALPQGAQHRAGSDREDKRSWVPREGRARPCGTAEASPRAVHLAHGCRAPSRNQSPCYNPTWIPVAKAEHRWDPPLPGSLAALFPAPLGPATRGFTALCAGSGTHLDGLQGVVQLPPLFWLLPLRVEAVVVDPKVEVHLHEAEVVVLVVQAQLVETCREKRGVLFPAWKSCSGFKPTLQGGCSGGSQPPDRSPLPLGGETRAAGTCLPGGEVDLSSCVLGSADLEAVGVARCGQDDPAVSEARRPLDLQAGDSKLCPAPWGSRPHPTGCCLRVFVRPGKQGVERAGQEPSRVPRGGWPS